MLNRQRHSSSCGPIALANVTGLSYAAVLEFCKACIDYKHKEGTYVYQLQAGLEILGHYHIGFDSITLKDAHRYLDEGYNLIVLYKTLKWAHFVAVTGRTEKLYDVWNMSKHVKTPRIGKVKFKKMLRKTQYVLIVEKEVTF